MTTPEETAVRIVVTGGAGRVGAYVVRELVGRGDHEVTVFDRVAPPFGTERVRWIQGDITDFGEVVSALARADAVSILAASG